MQSIKIVKRSEKSDEHLVKNIVRIKNREEKIHFRNFCYVFFFFFDRLSFLMLFCRHRAFLSFIVIGITVSIKIGKLVTLSLSLSDCQVSSSVFSVDSHLQHLT